MAFDYKKYRPTPVIKRPERRWPDKVLTQAPVWCAVDLRDGNQALVKPMTVAQKTRLFTLLVELGFKEIEVGFPAASQPDFDFVRKIVEENLVPEDVTIQVLTQAREDLIARSFEALKGARRAVVHLYNSTSKVQREKVFRMDVAGITSIAVQGANWVKAYAKQYPDTQWVFQYSPESFTGTELPIAQEVVNAVIDVWQPQHVQEVIINLPATVEVSTPNVYADMVEWMNDNIHHREHIVLSLHTHNDRGCGVAAAELGVLAGADRVEGTLLGNGERTGNMDLVTMGMNLYSQGIDPKIDFSRMKDIVDTVEAVTEISTHPRHPYAGELVFTAFSGSHQDAIRKCLATYKEGDEWEIAYLPIDPSDVGRRYEEVVRINSQSGKGGVLYVLERDYGITLPRWLQIEFSRLVQQVAENEAVEVDGERIHALFKKTYLQAPKGWQVQEYHVQRDDKGVHVNAKLDGNYVGGQGQGGIEALVEGMSQHTGLAIAVETFDEFAIGDGTEAKAMACLRVLVNQMPYSAAAIARDTTAAAFQALATAVGRGVQAQEAKKVG